MVGLLGLLGRSRLRREPLIVAGQLLDLSLQLGSLLLLVLQLRPQLFCLLFQRSSSGILAGLGLFQVAFQLLNFALLFLVL